MRIPFIADDAAVAAIDRLGRTEDVEWSPSGRRLALAGYLSGRVLILDVDVRSGEAPRAAVSGGLEITSPSFTQPHGVSWLDEHTLVVANRGAQLGIFELPASLPACGAVTLDPVRTIGEDRRDLVTNPGSVSVFPIGLGLVELLVCSTYAGHVSRHLVDARDGYAVCTSESLISAGLRVPDGVGHSRSGRWIAVSNHDEHSVLVFRNDDRLHDASVPDGVLRGVLYPHGLVFSPDERWLLVADAGAPVVHAFRSEDGSWNGERGPAASIQVMSDAGFQRGNYQPAEGGPKGIDLTADGTVMVATAREDRLGFFDMRPILGNVGADPDPSDRCSEAERARLYLLRYLGAARSRVDDATASIRRISDREVQRVVMNRWWRATAPFRRMSESLQIAAHRARQRLKQ